MANNEIIIRDHAADIAELIRGDLSPKALQVRLEEFHAGDIAKAAELLTPAERTKLFRTLEPDSLADVFNTSSRKTLRNTSAKPTCAKPFC